MRFPAGAPHSISFAAKQNKNISGEDYHAQVLLAAVRRPRRACRRRLLRRTPTRRHRRPADRSAERRGGRGRPRRTPTPRRSTRATSSSPRRAAPRSCRTCRSPSPRSAPKRCRIRGATDIRQLNQLAPSLLVSSTGSEANGSARIRGIGTVGDNPGLESSVAVFIDGVYRSRIGIGLNELGEIERIEVLRGPQGTLFGRNASAGLIHIITKKPDIRRRRLWRS